MRAPLHRRTEEIGACLADPFANGEGGKDDTFTIPKGRRRQVYQPRGILPDEPHAVNPGVLLLIASIIVALMHLHPDRG